LDRLPYASLKISCLFGICDVRGNVILPAFDVVFIKPTSVNVDTKAAMGFLLYNERPK
jgi:hypothetical protein